MSKNSFKKSTNIEPLKGQDFTGFNYFSYCVVFQHDFLHTRPYTTPPLRTVTSEILKISKVMT